jgi:hypothetical protein
MSGDTQRQTIAEKLRGLPPERVAEVEDFIDFLRTREADRQLTRAGTRLAEASFRAVWDNPTMPTTTAYEFGDVVLVPFPFTDQSGSSPRSRARRRTSLPPGPRSPIPPRRSA